jgi:hypothetical protein
MTTGHALRQHRFTLRMIAAAERDGRSPSILKQARSPFAEPSPMVRLAASTVRFSRDRGGISYKG